MNGMKEMVYTIEHKRTILYDGVYRKHKFAIISQGTHPTAYVECKIKNCYDYDDDRVLDINCHGGFTYFGKNYWSEEEDTSNYLGWDYAHSGDYVANCIGTAFLFQEGGEKEWTTLEIFVNVKQTIDELIEIEIRE